MPTSRQPTHETARPARGRTAPPAAAGEVLPPAGTELVDWRAESREPRAESREPRAESREPRAESREPRAESREPRAESREPRAESREPRAESREPRAESREPRAESREPRAESREPRAESREPRAESREPRAESREPRAESREPRASLYACAGGHMHVPGAGAGGRASARRPGPSPCCSSPPPASPSPWRWARRRTPSTFPTSVRGRPGQVQQSPLAQRNRSPRARTRAATSSPVSTSCRTTSAGDTFTLSVCALDEDDDPTRQLHGAHAARELRRRHADLHRTDGHRSPAVHDLRRCHVGYVQNQRICGNYKGVWRGQRQRGELENQRTLRLLNPL